VSLHRLDLIGQVQHYAAPVSAELLEIRQAILPHFAAVLPVRGPGQPKGIPRQIAELLEARAARTDCPTSLADGRGHRPKSVATEIAEAKP
jgi:hypothetical protein